MAIPIHSKDLLKCLKLNASGIIKYTKGGDAFDKDRSEEQLGEERHVIRPHTDP